MIRINNLPTYATEYRYVVATLDLATGDLWFWGAFNEMEKVFSVMEERSTAQWFRSEDVVPA